MSVSWRMRFSSGPASCAMRGKGSERTASGVQEMTRGVREDGERRA